MRKKILIVWILVISIVTCSIPASALSNKETESLNSFVSDIIDDNPEVTNELNSKIGCGISEIESLREENVKHYQLADGTYQAFSFGTPVHRLDENGKWQDIDNRLYKYSGAYRTADGRFTFAEAVSDEFIYEICDGKYILSVGLLSDVKNAFGAVVDNHKEKADLSSFKNDDEKVKSFTDIDTTTKVSYKEVFSDVDFEYIISANNLKENIVLKSKDADNDLVFSLNVTGLTAKLNDLGGIVLADKDSGETRYNIPAPFMYDANGQYSDDVSYELIDSKSGNYSLRIIVNEDWLNAENTTYPIVIDPSLNSSNVYYDTYIYSSNPSTNYGLNSQLWVSSGRITYMRMIMPTLPTYANISYASLTARYHYNVTTGSLDIGVYQCLNSWTETGLTWNQAAKNTNMGLSTVQSGLATAAASASITASNPGFISFSLTNLVKQWYAGEPNYGIGLKYVTGSNYSVILESWEASSNYRAYYTISYSIISPTVSNGTYFFKNGKLENYMQIDNDDSSNNYCTNDAILELFDFDGNEYQKWTLTYLHNGYYKIISAKSSKAVSVKSGKENTGEQALRQQTYIADSRQQWKITSAHNGQFKIKPRSSEGYSTDWVMAAGNGIGTNGRNVEQRKYINNPSYLDEWNLCMTNPNFTNMYIGASDGDTAMPGILLNVRNQFNRNLYYGNSLNSSTKKELIYMLKNSEVFSAITHGNQTAIRLTGDVSFSTSDVNAFSSSDLNNLVFVYLGACETGKGGSSATNLVNSLFSKGVDNVIGFTISVLIDETNFWTPAFMSNIANGQSIATAITNADFSIQNDPTLGGRTSYTISNRLIRGSIATVPCP